MMENGRGEEERKLAVIINCETYYVDLDAVADLNPFCISY